MKNESVLLKNSIPQERNKDQIVGYSGCTAFIIRKNFALLVKKEKKGVFILHFLSLSVSQIMG